MNLTVIATDGYPIEPIVVNSFVSSAGERFDVVIDVENNTNISNLLPLSGLSIFVRFPLNQYFFYRFNFTNCSRIGCVSRVETSRICTNYFCEQHYKLHVIF